jgi:divalent metal cation (Fe/Co/Zn/Cd) transporter
MMLAVALGRTSRCFLVASLVYFVLMFAATITIHLEVLRCVKPEMVWGVYFSLAASAFILAAMILMFVVLLKYFNRLTSKASDFRSMEA